MSMNLFIEKTLERKLKPHQARRRTDCLSVPVPVPAGTLVIRNPFLQRKMHGR
jgi:hypothetical protein